MAVCLFIVQAGVQLCCGRGRRQDRNDNADKEVPEIVDEGAAVHPFLAAIKARIDDKGGLKEPIEFDIDQPYVEEALRSTGRPEDFNEEHMGFVIDCMNEFAHTLGWAFTVMENTGYLIPYDQAAVEAFEAAEREAQEEEKRKQAERGGPQQRKRKGAAKQKANIEEREPGAPVISVAVPAQPAANQHHAVKDASKGGNHHHLKPPKASKKKDDPKLAASPSPAKSVQNEKPSRALNPSTNVVTVTPVNPSAPPASAVAVSVSRAPPQRSQTLNRQGERSPEHSVSGADDAPSISSVNVPSPIPSISAAVAPPQLPIARSTTTIVRRTQTNVGSPASPTAVSPSPQPQSPQEQKASAPPATAFEVKMSRAAILAAASLAIGAKEKQKAAAAAANLKSVSPQSPSSPSPSPSAPSPAPRATSPQAISASGVAIQINDGSQGSAVSPSARITLAAEEAATAAMRARALPKQ